MNHSPVNDEELRLEKPVYGGDTLGRTAAGEVKLVPFALPGELVRLGGTPPSDLVQIVERSAERTEPGCVHFGACGGCQYQMADYDAQLRFKEQILLETLQRSGVVPEVSVQPHASAEAWGYRNRIRLRVGEQDGQLCLGYNRRGSRAFLRVRMCPLAAPVLWATAEALLQAASVDALAATWLRAAAEIEIGCNADATQVQVHLLCPGVEPRSAKTRRPPQLLPPARSFAALGDGVKAAGVPLVAMSASRVQEATGRPAELLASWGAEGLVYQVGTERFWLQRGSFFQVNRFLVATMVELVTGEWAGAARRGGLAWDLFAGVGLFARALARTYAGVTAVEANADAVKELRRGLRRATDRGVEATTIAFLRQAVVERERPDLVVVDPPRAGLGEEASSLLAKLRPTTLVYVSCDPATLARDAAVLTAAGYAVTELHLLDLFPQTYHLETVMVLQPAPVQA